MYIDFFKVIFLSIFLLCLIGWSTPKQLFETMSTGKSVISSDDKMPKFKDVDFSPNIFLSAFNVAMWIKLRILYYANNWIYTTNHKRIAVNYYWFVIFAGICGMVLATIIRLEMAYPGVGILAGDSLQYLSVVTAHAVIMVFFMIMPLLFGAFGNFLLPTQLGVHDVAFPRLNSAAFWFLPAGLLMLVQLVCLDRRYQRMNCYNIREIQTILKSKYSPNTSDAADVRFNLNDTVLGVRYSASELNFLDPAMFVYYKNALLQNPTYRAFHNFIHKPIVEFDSVKYFMSKTSLMFSVLKVMYEDETFDVRYMFANSQSTFFTTLLTTSDLALLGTSHKKFNIQPLNLFEVLNPLTLVQSGTNSLTQVGTLLSNFLTTSSGSNSLLQEFAYSIRNVISLFLTNSVTNWGSSTYWLALLNYLYTLPLTLTSGNFFSIFTATFSYYFNLLVKASLSFMTDTSNFNMTTQSTPTYSTSDLNNTDVVSTSTHMLQEDLADSRFSRFMNPVFKYDFKVGNYIPDDVKKMNPHLFNTIKDVTTGIRKSSWFTSDDYSRLLKSNIASHMLYFSDVALTNPSKNTLAGVNADLDGTFAMNSYHSTNATFTGGFFNFFLLLNSSSEVINSRWIALNSLDQKFYKMFATSSMQQRIYANWRQLKFTREAWRCKLLAARHQNTLYKRYLNEDSVVWAVERNAKDVLPGWAMITPFSARSRFTAIGKVDIGLMGVFLVLNSSIVSSANFLVTYRYLSTLNNRKMRDARSFFTEGVMVASWMMIAANPMLAIGILMLLSDRHWQTSFFDYSGGGDTVLFQHMFWFFGHPEVYVIMIPAFGFNNTILSFYLRKRVSARASLLYSMYTIAFLGFFVWGHHMYMVGLAHTTRMLFSTLTVMISVPAATKLMHWCVTLVNSSFVLELPMFFQLLFIFFFVSGGISGMAVAHTGMDILFHDSFYVVGHFHVMLAGSAMFASFGAFYFYFPAIFGVKYSRLYGYLHAIYYLTGQLMTVIPMFWLGYAAMPRRVLDYPAALGGWHAVVSAGHMLSVAGMMAFFIMIFDSIRQGRAATRNSFGVARFNTRLNFYIYEGARTWFLQRKGWYLSRFNRHNSVRLNKLNFTNNEYLETTLYTYVIIRKNSKNV